MDYQNQDALALAQLIKAKKISPEEVLEAAFQQIETLNPSLNAVVRTRKEKALAELQTLDLKAPFAGVPILLKDLGQEIKGELNTAGARLLKDYRSSFDSHYTKKMREAGFVIIGQTNSPEFGFKNITDPILYGKTNNPWNKAHSAGGSSGGSAAAVASGMVPLAGSSDGGGSIRIPASFTGLVGLKVTRGRTPVGPGTGRKWQGAAVDFALSRSVRDSAALLDCLQVVEESAAFQTPLFSGKYLDLVQQPTKKRFRIAYTTQSPVGTAVSQAAKDAVMKAVDYFAQEGHFVEEKDNGIDGIHLMRSYFLMNGGETAAMFSNLENALGRTITEKDVELMTWAIYQMGKSVTAAEYSRSLALWDQAAEMMAHLHQSHDFYLTPSSADLAPLHDALQPDETMKSKLLAIEALTPKNQQALIYEMFEKSLAVTPFTQLANLTGQPAISLPLHMSQEGLPMGVQLMAAKGREDLLFIIAKELEESSLWRGV